MTAPQQNPALHTFAFAYYDADAVCAPSIQAFRLWVSRRVEGIIREAMRTGLPWSILMLREMELDNGCLFWIEGFTYFGECREAPAGCLEAGLTMQGLIPFIEAAGDQLTAWAKDDPPLDRSDLKRLFAHLPAEKWIEPTGLPANPD